MEIKRALSKKGTTTLDELQLEIQSGLDDGISLEILFRLLDENERKVIDILLFDCTAKTLRECGDLIERSPERVRQRLGRAYRKIKSTRKRISNPPQEIEIKAPKDMKKIGEAIRQAQKSFTKKILCEDFDIDTLRQFNWYKDRRITFMSYHAELEKLHTRDRRVNNNADIYDIQEILNRGARMGYSLRQLFRFCNEFQTLMICRLFLNDEKLIRDHFYNIYSKYEFKKDIVSIYRRIHGAIGTDLITKFNKHIELYPFAQEDKHYENIYKVYSDVDNANLMYFEWFYHLKRDELVKFQYMCQDLQVQ